MTGTEYERLIKDLRYESTWCEDFPEQKDLFIHAADAIEQLGRMLCNWCGVCPEERRNIWECEIAFPNAEVPEVWIEPPKETI